MRVDRRRFLLFDARRAGPIMTLPVRLLLTGLAASAVVGCATGDPEVVATQIKDHDYEQQFIDEWPLTVRGGTLSCRPDSREVFFSPAGADQRYVLVTGSGAADLPSIAELTRPGGDLSRLIRQGERLCDTPQ